MSDLLGIATVYSLGYWSLPAACFLGLFLCGSLTINGRATFGALPASVWAPHASPCLSVGHRWLSRKLCLCSSSRHADHPDWWEMATRLALIWARAPSSCCATTREQGSGLLHLQGCDRAMGLEPRNSPLLFGHAGAVQVIRSACLAGQMELVHQLWQGPSVQVPRGNLHLYFTLDRAWAFEANLSTTTLQWTSEWSWTAFGWG